MNMKIIPIIIAFLIAMALLPAASAYELTISGSAPPTRGSIMKINVVDKTSSSFAPSNLTVRIDYTENGAAKSIVTIVPITLANQEVSLELPLSEFNPIAHITASAFGYYDSTDELTVTSGQYWNAVSQSTDRPKRDSSGITGKPLGDDNIMPPAVDKAPYLAQHTFTLARKPGFTPDAKTDGTSSGSGGCFGTEFILLSVIGCTLFLSARKA